MTTTLITLGIGLVAAQMWIIMAENRKLKNELSNLKSQINKD